MKYSKKVFVAILTELILAAIIVNVWLYKNHLEIATNNTAVEQNDETESESESETEAEDKYIKWVDYNISLDAMNLAYEYDVMSREEEIKLNWIELLAYVGAKNGGSFPSSATKELKNLVEILRSKESTIELLTKEMKYYDYYFEAYSAVLGGLVGEYEIEIPSEDGTGGKVWVTKYGIKAFSPIAKGFYYNGYDDFGVSRSYGFKRQHLGHDMMGQIGSPIIAIESGVVEAIGWNKYGGWRLGIRSFDGKRYYYYAHLRQNFPYNKLLKEGSVVQAGDVIGYMGHTGYSDNENVNNIKTVHLHMGIQLIFDESQKEGNNEIWIDCYNIVRFLYKNKSETVKNEETKEWTRIYQMRDPAYLDFIEK